MLRELFKLGRKNKKPTPALNLVVYDVIRHELEQRDVIILPWDQALKDFQLAESMKQQVITDREESARAERTERERMSWALKRVREGCNTDHRVRDLLKNGVRWEVTLGLLKDRDAKIERVIGSVCRFHPSMVSTIQIYRSKSLLEDFLVKLGENTRAMDIGRKKGQQDNNIRLPHPPSKLRNSADTVYELDFKQIYRVIGGMRKDLIKKLGKLPTTPQFVKLHPGARGFIPILSVRFEEEKP